MTGTSSYPVSATSLTAELMNRTTVSCTNKEITIVCDDHDTKDAIMEALVSAAYSAPQGSGGESGCPRKCGEADDGAGSGIDRNCEDTTQGDRPAAMVKVPSPEHYLGDAQERMGRDEIAKRISFAHLGDDREWKGFRSHADRFLAYALPSTLRQCPICARRVASPCETLAIATSCPLSSTNGNTP